MSATKTAKAGPGRPAGIDSGDTRQRVIDAACRCFAELGYGPATNNQIAELAGVTAGSVYYHFGTKNKLFEAVCDDVYGKILTSATAAVVGPHTLRDLLRAVLAGATWIDGKTICAENSVGQCHPTRAEPALSDVEPSG